MKIFKFSPHRKKFYFILCLIVCTLSLRAQVKMPGQLHFEQKRISVQDIVNSLKTKYGFKVSFNTDVNMATMVTLSSEDVSFETLASVLQQQASIGIKNIDGNVVIKRLELVSVSGIVLSADDKQPLVGVTITDVNKKFVGSTNIDGKFSVRVPRSTAVNFSMVGYEAQKQVYNSNALGVSITLNATAATLNEVVVTALGIKREEKALGYAATVVKGQDLTDALSNNWTDALSGKVAGLNLIRSNSGPMGSTKIILRGENNLTGDNAALIVLDGVVISSSSGRRSAIAGESVYGTSSDNMPADYGSNVDDLNPEDIESVTVLKGAAAAALYGERGNNGAVIITTKSGNSKKKGLGVTLNSNASIANVNRWPALQYEYGQGLAGANYYSYGASADGASTSGTSSAYGPRFDGQMFYQFDPTTQTVGKTRTPWVAYPNSGVKQYFNQGQTYTNTVTVDGGNDRTSGRFSVTNVKNTWIVPNTGYGRNSAAMSINSKLTDKLTINSKVTYDNRFSDNLPGAGYGNQSIMYWFIFWQPSADINWLKNYWKLGQTDRAIEYPFSSFPENPYAVAYEFLNKSNRNAITGNASATYQFTKELSLQLRTSLDMSYEQREQDRPYDAGSKYVYGSYRTQDIFNQEVSGDFLLRYAKKIGKDFDLSVTAGGSMLANRYRKDEVRADSLTYPGVYSYSNAKGPLIYVTSPDNPYQRYNINSFYGIMDVAYKSYLYLELTDRQDYNSNLATPLRTNSVGLNFPSASASFILSDVAKMPSYIDYLKFRASAAQVGNGGLDAYRTAFNYVSAGSLFGGGLSNPSLLTNPNIQPLRTTTYEVGTEVNMLKNRIGFDLALYAGNTKNQQLVRQLDRSSGYPSFITNVGQVNNQGVEFSIHGSPIKSDRAGGFNWTLMGTFTANRNKIISLPDSTLILRTGSVGGGQVVAKVGGSMGDLYGNGFLRAPDGQIVYDKTTGFAKLAPGVVYLGNTMPKYKVSWGSTWTYKNIALHVLFDAQHGAVAHSLMNYKMVEQGKLQSTLPGRYNGIIGNGVVQNADGSYSPNTTLTFDVDNYYRSQMGQDNAEGSTFSTDFIKFREASLSYTLPVNLVKKAGLQRVTIGVYGRDLFIWSPWPMFDPEFGTLSGTDITTGFEIGQFPSTRTLGANLTVSF
ncbi:TonB-linked SusC/RagA family outer membrane protein [Mucilaginibacter yixingensis]|uniref:TonB-linked SusC/RagA family outer membrane protein n=1 Tax=Mucilaginibacter yixingensis TaxID=1295612 RepID=A0A2T5JFK5_9SPHI|nr:SusC/RagA family TonB-linked outer membrane protein [Mucilaginibacter yixingensis]PTR01195.1 TonB-linked SusC/RagA family outer membrane protein [Mucilaginibacter yixingensis]